MNSKPFPMGVVVTLTILWLGLVGAMAWGWSSTRAVFEEGPAAATPVVSASGHATSTSGSADTTAAVPAGPRLVWSQEGLQRFGLKAGGAALGAILFLLLAVGAGVLVQEKAESASE